MAREVLVAASDKGLQRELERVFEATGYQLFFTSDDEEALIRGRLLKPDFVIGGKRLCERMKTEEDLAQIPFILLLGQSEELSESERKFLQPEGVISRPLSEEAVHHMIGTLRDKKGKGEFLLDESWESDEEIIELVDVIEEPEPKMSIEDLALQTDEEPLGEMPVIDSWEASRQEEGEISKEFEMILEEGEGRPEETFMPQEKAAEFKETEEDELFKKIEMDEIIQKVEQLRPSLEKELQVGEPRLGPEASRTASKLPDPYSLLQEFETTLKVEEALTPMSLREESQKAFEPALEEMAESLEKELQELEEDEFPEAFLEELTSELEKLEEVEVEEGAALEEPEEVMATEEGLEELMEEGVLTPVPEEVSAPEEAAPPAEALTPLEPLLEEAWVPGPEVAQPPEEVIEKGTLVERPIERAIEEVIARGVQEMVQEFTRTVIPEIAAKVITHTMERIEQLVREIVPELAEKAIREEIERLQRMDEK